MKKEWKYILPLVSLFVIFIVLQIVLPKPLDWKQSFSNKDKIPYGNEALYHLSQDIFPDKKIIPVYQTIYQELDSLKDKEVNNNYLFITNNFKPTEEDVSRLLTFTKEGGNVFIAARSYSEAFADTFNISTFARYFFNQKDSTIADSVSINFVNKTLQKDSGYNFKREVATTYFESYDTSKTKVLARNSEDDAIFIEVTAGKGSFYLSSTPLIYTNYYVLNNSGAEFISKSLSHLPVEDVLWDEYYKPGVRKAQTPLRFILSEEALKWAYFITLFSLILFVLFKAKRRQRIIPVITPPANNTVEFAETIGKLYQNYGNHKDAADKRIRYLLDQLRTKYNFRVNTINSDFAKIVSHKTGVDLELTIKLQNQIEKIQKASRVEEEDLLKLNIILEDFYKTIKERYGK